MSSKVTKGWFNKFRWGSHYVCAQQKHQLSVTWWRTNDNATDENEKRGMNIKQKLSRISVLSLSVF